MEAVSASETSIGLYQTRWRSISEAAIFMKEQFVTLGYVYWNLACLFTVVYVQPLRGFKIGWQGYIPHRGEPRSGILPAAPAAAAHILSVGSPAVPAAKLFSVWISAPPAAQEHINVQINNSCFFCFFSFHTSDNMAAYTSLHNVINLRSRNWPK
jgi:hypothetical protein